MDIKRNPGVKINLEILYKPNKNLPRKESLAMSSEEKQTNADTIIISDEAKKIIADKDNSESDNKTLREANEMLKDLKEMANQKDDIYGVYIKCLEISSRIIKGDNVPPKDIQFLAENEPKLFSDSILLRQEKSNPKDYDSLLEDEDVDSTVEDTSQESLAELNVNVSLKSDE